jgi:NFU1 iron-sulfur cluster scaffold homolog, mitochondrial
LSFVVKEVQPTPNPNAMKFVLDRVISDRPMSFLDPSSGKDHEIAARLFEISGVTHLLFVGDFVTVAKRPEARWSEIKTKVEQTLAAL